MRAWLAAGRASERACRARSGRSTRPPPAARVCPPTEMESCPGTATAPASRPVRRPWSDRPTAHGRPPRRRQHSGQGRRRRAERRVLRRHSLTRVTLRTVSAALPVCVAGRASAPGRRAEAGRGRAAGVVSSRELRAAAAAAAAVTCVSGPSDLSLPPTAAGAGKQRGESRSGAARGTSDLILS